MAIQSKSIAQINAPTFDIVINYSGDPTYQQYFIDAAKMWELIIKGDVSDQTVSSIGFVDDLYIDASIVLIDGVNGTLGYAGPDIVRPNNITTTSSMQFDLADMPSLVADGSIASTIQHEMGHVLGLGTLWENINLVSKIPDATKPDGYNYLYVGAAALAEYRLLSGNAAASFIQVESTQGGSGTIGGHWDEDIFLDEGMTGYINAGSNPFSRMTIASLRDLGYTVDLGNADAYFMPPAVGFVGTPLAYRDDFSGNYNTTTTITIGSTQNGVIELNEDNDWFQVNLEAGNSYTFTMKGSFSGQGTLTDSFLRLHAFDGETIAFNDNNSSGSESSFSYEATTTGLFYLDAAAAGTQTGTYQLGVKIDLPFSFTEGADNYTVLASGKTWHALGGDDFVIGSSGSDTIYGDNGNDTIRGGAGADTLIGGNDSDLVDYSSSSAGVSVFLNVTTAQSSSGDASGDILSGFEKIIGSSSGDSLGGDAGANFINAWLGNDYLTGGAGADHLVGGDGFDYSSYYYSSQGVLVDLNLATAQVSAGDASGDLLVGIEGLLGSNLGNDNLYGDAASNYIAGNGGDDWIRGGAGADTLAGGNGTDLVDYSTSSSGVNVNLNLSTAQTSGGDAAGDILSGFEKIIGTSGDDTLIGDGAANFINGWLGNDTIRGGAGADNLVGGDGIDLVDYSSSAAGVNVFLNVTTAQSSAGDASGDVLSGFEKIIGSLSGDSLGGSSGDNFINGWLGDDYLTGGAGADHLVGGDGYDYSSYYYSAAGVTVNLNLATAQVSAGDASGDLLQEIEGLIGSNTGSDTLIGNAISNNLSGNGGADFITGAGGGDLMSGGAGNDTFNFAAGFGKDVITDFTAGAGIGDVIRLTVGTAIDTFAEVFAASTQSGANTLITITANDTITLNNVLKTALVADDFTFV